MDGSNKIIYDHLKSIVIETYDQKRHLTLSLKIPNVELVFDVSAWVVINVETLIIDFDVCVVIFNVSYIKSFYVKYLMFGTSNILHMSFSVMRPMTIRNSIFLGLKSLILK